MTLTEQTDYVMKHPAWVEAMGDIGKMRELLNDLQLHCVETQVRASAREYGSCRRMNYSDIKESLLGIGLPRDFNIYLKIPKVCKVVDMVVRKKPHRYVDPMQLVIEFPIFVLAVAL